jgi:light-regulated signal transduction histidine kinase (bacteriophytochrome)
MDYLIDGILTYAKIDKINVTREKVNVDEIVRNIINIIDVPYNSVVSIKMPVILGDRFRVQQLFQIL